MLKCIYFETFRYKFDVTYISIYNSQKDVNGKNKTLQGKVFIEYLLFRSKYYHEIEYVSTVTS